jgi:hypothetical protein
VFALVSVWQTDTPNTRAGASSAIILDEDSTRLTEALLMMETRARMTAAVQAAALLMTPWPMAPIVGKTAGALGELHAPTECAASQESVIHTNTQL